MLKKPLLIKSIFMIILISHKTFFFLSVHWYKTIIMEIFDYLVTHGYINICFSHQHVNFMLNDTILVINMNQMDTSMSFLSKIKKQVEKN